jgi:hypothetical protein
LILLFRSIVVVVVIFVTLLIKKELANNTGFRWRMKAKLWEPLADQIIVIVLCLFS